MKKRNFRLKLLIRFRPVLRFVRLRILHVHDSPGRIAGGVAIGFFVGFLPLLGLHMVLALLAACLFRANKAIAVLATWISNPFTFVLIYYPDYRLGRVVSAFFHRSSPVSIEQLQTLLARTFSLNTMLLNLFTADYWKQVAAVFAKIGMETCIGGIILGGIAAAMGYRIAYYFIIGYRTRQQARKSARQHSPS